MISVTIQSPIDVLVLHDRPFDAREEFKKRVVTCIQRFIRRSPFPEIRERKEDTRWDLGADANLSLVSVVLATCLEQIGARYKVWDMDNLLLYAREHVLADLRKAPKIIAVSSSHYTTGPQFSEFIRFLREHNQRATIIVGGQLLETWPDLESLAPGVDYYVYGDGEVVFPALVKAILENKTGAALDFPGVRRREGSGYKGSSQWEMLDIDRLPVPRWELTLKRDFNAFAPRRSQFIPLVFVEEVRGCMYQCAFCAYPRGIPHRIKSTARILSELRENVQSGFRHFNFYSALFTSPPQHCRDILNGIIRERLGLTFSCQARIDDLYRNPDLIDLMKEAGCIHISMGIESGDTQLLRKMKKPLDVARIPGVIKKIKECDISACGNFFVGFPGETDQSVQVTYDLIRECNFLSLYLSSFVVERAADVYLNREKYGLEVSPDWQRWKHHTMTSEEAEDHTARIFMKLAHDDSIETVAWVVQWRVARFFPEVLRNSSSPDLWPVLRLMQKGVADEMRFMLDGGSEAELDARQGQLWHQILAYPLLSEENSAECRK